jgi:hypothetical protein
MPHRRTPIEPPIVAREPRGKSVELSTIEDVIEYVRRREEKGWNELRDAAFVAAAIPSPENIQELRRLVLKATG